MQRIGIFLGLYWRASAVEVTVEPHIGALLGGWKDGRGNGLAVHRLSLIDLFRALQLPAVGGFGPEIPPGAAFKEMVGLTFPIGLKPGKYVGAFHLLLFALRRHPADADRKLNAGLERGHSTPVYALHLFEVPLFPIQQLPGS